ncbi:2-keto-4-pentenoate hydratase [Gordonia hydrophobica]|uniref:Fumarylacetoacetate hydrolase family protein n=1 Tax=Gordonia hydrophobica TaxID=40516 RepID=A0ABZ2U5E2_9ACTN|nr:fumarylacetoacetate hydrolase family protein [Gordonia hydrophobica]MBM7368782.1 2-oxo-3-hexenedioate decarboxylase [Gordonia hydrophobica]
MTTWNIDRAATVLLDAEDRRADREPLTDEWPELDLSTAYRIQDETLRRRQERGEKIVGVKLGLTSKAKQQRMGIDVPLVAWLTDAMILDPDEPVPIDELIHPRVEPEIVFVMGARLAGPGVTADEARAAVAQVHGGLEVIDSRYRDFRFTLPDVVADNSSSGKFVMNLAGRPAAEVDAVAEACTLSHGGKQVATATGADVMGDPAAALALAANVLAERGLAIEPGWIVLTGGMTDAVHLVAGDVVRIDFASLGELTITGA